MRNTYFRVFLILIFSSFGSFLHPSPNSNGLYFFLQEFRDGVKTGDYLFLKLNVYNGGKSSSLKWNLTYEWLKNSQSDSEMIVPELKNSRSNDDYGRPCLKNVVWHPDQSIECDFMEGTSSFHLMAIKVGKKYNDWKVEGNGTSNFYAGEKPQKWHFEGVKEIELQKKKMTIGEIFK